MSAAPSGRTRRSATSAGDRRGACDNFARSAPVAQWIEQPPPKGQVARSIRVRGASLKTAICPEPGIPLKSAHVADSTRTGLLAGLVLSWGGTAASIQKIVSEKGVIAWRVQIELRGRRAYKTFPVKNLAVAWANQREAEIVQGKVQSSSVAERTPFSEVIKEYRKKELEKLKNRSYKYMLNTLEKRFGRHRLIDLQKKDFAKFRD